MELTFEAAFSRTESDTEEFEQAVLARYVEMTITDNWRDLQGALPGGDRVGLGEVAFPVFKGSLQPLPGVVNPKLEGDGRFAITFDSSPGVDYELDRSTNGQDWTRLGVSIEGSPDETSILADPNPPTDTQVVLYRVVQP